MLVASIFHSTQESRALIIILSGASGFIEPKKGNRDDECADDDVGEMDPVERSPFNRRRYRNNFYDLLTGFLVS